LALLFAALFFSACASNEKATPAADGAAPKTAETKSGTGSGLLMDRYKTGEIPGYREANKAE
jgi:hypothetical protein